MIDAYASEPHYRAHIEPLWEALPSPGTFHTRPPRFSGPPTVVASFKDLKRIGPRVGIYMEHGSGQTYSNRHPSYAGGPHKGNVGLFLLQHERVAAVNRVWYPDTPEAIVGCPLLDRWIGHKPHNAKPVVALAWHWDASVAPEGRSAFRHYLPALSEVAKRWKVLGHAHPRKLPLITRDYQEAGIEVVEDFAEVMRRADVLAFDNTSAGYMFAATGRPVVVLNAPWYRRTVDFGLRFWEFADVGVQVDEPEQLVTGIRDALTDTPARARRREEVSQAIYANLDGTAARRASEAVMAVAA